jgi:hypothetical protein
MHCYEALKLIRDVVTNDCDAMSNPRIAQALGVLDEMIECEEADYESYLAELDDGRVL